VQRACEEWSRWSPDESIDDSELGGGSRADRIRWFRARLAQWAKDQHGTWRAAGEALACDEKTLRKDAILVKQ